MSRQLQDPIIIMTSNLPSWLKDVASACPFLFPFETRQVINAVQADGPYIWQAFGGAVNRPQAINYCIMIFSTAVVLCDFV